MSCNRENKTNLVLFHLQLTQTVNVFELSRFVPLAILALRDNIHL
jgi:hypothetical protein